MRALLRFRPAWARGLRHSKKQDAAKRKRRPQLESLEQRALLTVSVRSIDGTGNNLSNPNWGSTGVDLLRKAPAEYADGLSAPAGDDRLGAREISNLVSAQTTDVTNNRDMSAYVYAWGQFLDHDIDQTVSSPALDPFFVDVPADDDLFDPDHTGQVQIPLLRSNFDPATGVLKVDPTTGKPIANPRQQINSITAFIDGSQIYGSDEAREMALRTGQGGRMKTSAGNLLPFNTMGVAMDNQLHADPTTLFAAGDSRANENIELTAMQTLFVREHNRLADSYAALHPNWSDEQIFQQARKIVIAELQAITYNEFLPALLGSNAMPDYRGYNSRVNPGIANEFSTAAFRLGHSLLGDDVEFFDNNGKEVHEPTELRDDFFNPGVVEEAGIDPILKYLASDRSNEIDTQVVDDVRSFLFGQPGQGGLDLAALNIQRGRDHGLADYNATRVAYGLRPVTSFADITSDVNLQKELRAAYGTTASGKDNVNDIDLWVGGLAEDHVRGGSVGPLIQRILVDQFSRLRDGDRFWYQRSLSSLELRTVEHTSLSDIIARNSTTTNLQNDVFFFRANVTGRVFFDTNADGRQGSREGNMPNIKVELLDTDGNVLATAITRRDGTYSFDDMDLNTYRVRLVLPPVLAQTTQQPRDLVITRGDQVSSSVFGVAAARLVKVNPAATPSAVEASDPTSLLDLS